MASIATKNRDGTYTPAQPQDPQKRTVDYYESNQRPTVHTDATTATDTTQGSLNDCTFISALNSLGSTGGSRLPSVSLLGQDTHHNNVYSVQLWKDNRWQEYDVSADTPSQAATSPNGSEYGPIIEKAVALANGGYDSINHGGTLHEALQEITGDIVTFSDANSSLGNVAAGRATTAGYASSQGGYFDSQTGQNNGYAKKSDHDIYINPQHAYSVVGVSGQAPNRTVTMQNPLNSGGSGTGGHPGNGSWGTFQISEKAYGAIFSHFCSDTQLPVIRNSLPPVQNEDDTTYNS